MSNNSATDNAATRNSDQVGNTAPNAAHDRHHRLEALIEKHFDNEFASVISALADSIGHHVDNETLVDAHRCNLVWEHTRVIRFLSELSETIHQ